MPEQSLREIREYLVELRPAFEMHVECVCLEITEMAKQVASAIGEISLEEARLSRVYKED